MEDEDQTDAADVLGSMHELDGDKLENGCKEVMIVKERPHNGNQQDVSTSCEKLIVLFGILYNAFLTLGFPFSFGTFYTELLEIFESTRWEASLVHSVFVGVSTGGGLPVGFLIHRFGVRKTMVAGSILSFLGLFSSWFATSLVHLIVTVGIVTGFGGCMVYVASTVIVAATFRKRRGVAMTATAAMAGLGPVILPKILDAMMISYGLRGTLLICGALYLNMLVTSMAVTGPNIQLASAKRDDERSLSRKLHQLLHPVFLSYSFTSMVTIGCMNVMFIVIVDFVIAKGMSRETGIDFILIANAMVTIFGLLVGFLKLIPRVHGAVVYCIFASICATGMTLMPIVEEYIGFTACLCAYSIGQGAYNGIQMVAVLDIVGQELLAFGIGVRGILTAIANPLGAVLAGWLYDRTGTYTLSFNVAGLSTIGACCLTLATIAISNCCRK